jgi:hypothetical protein
MKAVLIVAIVSLWLPANLGCVPLSKNRRPVTTFWSRRDQDFKLSMIDLSVINSCCIQRVLSSSLDIVVSKTELGHFLNLI